MTIQAENSTSSDLKEVPLPEWTNSFLWNKRETVSRVDIFLLAMTVVIGGLMDDPFAGGLWVILASVFFTGVGYILLSFCLAEMTSTLPFSGGIYGFVRAFTNPLFGFYIAVFEFFVDIFYVSSQIYLLAEIPIYAGVYQKNMILPCCILVYIFVLAITLPGGKIFWLFNALIGAICLLLMIIFIFGSIPAADPRSYGNSQPFTFAHFLNVLPTTSGGYVGIQFLPLASKYAKDSRKDIPIVMCIAMVVIVILNVCSNLLACIQAPGSDAIEALQFSLSPGFGKIFGFSPKTATWIVFPGYLATAIGFLYCFGRQASSMSKSGLLPAIFQAELTFFESPYITLSLGCAICFLLNILMYFRTALVNEAALIAMLSSFIVYIGGCIAYLEFHRKYSNLTRFFTSPFGKAGAYVCIVIFLICIVGSVGFQATYISLIFCLIVSVLVFPIYFYFVKHNLMFSEEEKEELFKAYLINANLATKQKMKKKALKNNKVGPQTSDHGSNNNNNTTGTKKNINNRSQPRSLQPNSQQPLTTITNIQETQNDNGVSESCTPTVTTRLAEGTNSSVKHNPVLPSGSLPFVSSSVKAKSMSEKIVHFMSSKLNAILPEEDPAVKTLTILDQGGVFVEEEKKQDENKINVDNDLEVGNSSRP